MAKRAPREPASADTFRILILGPFAVFEGGASLNPGTWPPRAQSLLKLVATAPDHRRPRDEIIDLLWPDAAPEAGAANLRYTIHLLRRMFGRRAPSPILFEKHLVALDPTYAWTVDLEELEGILQRAGDDRHMLERAAELYRGEPLVEDRYADWAIPVRERAQRLWRDICFRLASLYRVHGAGKEAARWYERILDTDPLDEEAMLGLIEVLTALDRRVDALRRYRQFTEHLYDEIGVPPGSELQRATALLERHPAAPRHAAQRPEPDATLHPRTVIPSYNLPVTGSLLGRARELHALLTALPGFDRAGNESPRSLPRLRFIAAEAGMGKTRLLAEVAVRAREQGLLTLAGGCYEQVGQLPYGPVHDALLDYLRVQPEALLRTQLEGLQDDLGRILPGLRHAKQSGNELPPRAESERTRLFSAVSQALGRISQGRPLVLLLDDLQWADDATLHLLRYLSRQTHLQQLAVVGAYRTDELPPDAPLVRFVQDEEGGGPVAVVPLHALSDAEVTLLLQERLGGRCSPDLVRHVQMRSAGNAFFALQIARLLQESGRLTATAHGWTVEASAPLELPHAVRQTITRRLRGLGPDEREALSLGAILGREFPYRPLEALWEGDERSLFQSLDIVSDTHLLQEVEHGFTFSHPLLWEVVYWRIPAARRAWLHERAGLTLEAFYGDVAKDHAAELAFHFQSAGQVHRNRTARYLMLAGDAARRGYAWDAALAAYSSALAFVEDGSALAGLQERRGEILKALARFDEALEALDRATALYRELNDAEGEGRATVLLALVHHFRHSGSDEVKQLHLTVDRLERRGASRATLSRLYAALTRVHLLAGQGTAALETAERAIHQGSVSGDVAIVADAHLVHGRALASVERFEDACAAFGIARSLAEDIGDLFTVAAALDLTGGACMWNGNVAAAAEYLQRALMVEEQRGGLELLEETLDALADVNLFLGKWDQSRSLVRRSQALLGRQSPHARANKSITLASVSLYTGEWERLTEDVKESDDREPVRLTALLAEMNVLLGNADMALAHLEPLSGQPEAGTDARFLIPLAWAYLGTGNVADAGNVLEKAARAAERRRTYLPDVLRIRGLLLARQGCWSEAHDAFERAVREARPMPYPYSEARALYEWGRTLARECRVEEAGARIEEARSHLDDALAIFRRLGARPYMVWTEEMLDELAPRP